MKRRLVFLPVILSAFTTLQAHNPDTSYLRCKVAPHELELRFTFDPATLHRIVRPDADNDGKITRAEMETSTADILDYLEATVRLEINGKSVKLGERAGLGWPSEAGDAIAEKDYHTQLLHFTFRCRSQPLIEDVYVCYEVFAEFGDRHRVVADIEQEGRHQEVVYTMFEPDYLYDTGWSGEAGRAAADQAMQNSVPARFPDLFREGVGAVWNSNWTIVCIFVTLMLLSGVNGWRRATGFAAAVMGGIVLWEQFRDGPSAERSLAGTLGNVFGAALSVFVMLPVPAVVLQILVRIRSSGPAGG